MSDLSDNMELEEELREMAGYRSEDDQGLGVISASELDTVGNPTITDLYQMDNDERRDMVDPEDASDDSLDDLTSANLRDGETDDVMEAIEEGLTYVPPIDPPLQADADSADEVAVVNGFALDADEEGNETVASLARQVHVHLLHDAGTSQIAQRIRVRETSPGVIHLHGEIDDLTDEDLVIGVAEDVEGIEEVVSHLTVRGLGE
jgi:hypothetical protein